MLPHPRHRPAVAALLTAVACVGANAVTPVEPSVCAVLQAHLQADTLRELMVEPPLTLALNGRRATLTFRSEGTGLASNLVVTDAGTGEQFDPGLGEMSGDVRGDAVLIQLAGRHQVLFMARGNDAGSTLALDGGESCTVSRTRTASVAPTSTEPALCRRILSGEHLREIEFRQPVAIDDEVLAQRWDSDVMGGTHAIGSAWVDVANDRKPVRMALLEAHMRQPDICSVSLHDLLSADGKRLATDTERRTLAARGIVGDDPAQVEADCYGETHYLVDGKRVLIESLEHDQSDPDKVFARHVSINERGRVHEVCDFSFANEWTATPSPPEDATR